MFSSYSSSVSISVAAVGRAFVVAIGLSAANVWALPPAPAPLTAMAEQSPAAQGRVSRMLINPYGEVDGLRLADGAIIKFPPHMAAELIAAVKPGQMVRVFGRIEARGSVEADSIVNMTTAQTVFNQPPLAGVRRLPPHLRAQSLQTQKVEGRIDTVLTGPRGEINGVILADGSVVRFPPDSARLSMQQGAPFAASGLGTRNVYGTSLEAVRMGPSLSALQPIDDLAP
jgi:hypothetical protein